MAFLEVLAILGVAFVVVYGILDHFLGPDPDSLIRWYPADPEPGPLRRPCMTVGCRIDHDSMTESERRLMDGNR